MEKPLSKSAVGKRVLLSSNASKRWSGKIADIKKKKKKIEQNVKRLLAEQIEADKNDSDGLTEQSNREKQIEKLQKQAKRIEKWLKENDAKIGRTSKEIQSNLYRYQLSCHFQRRPYSFQE
jgi:hypothetical protein